MHSTFALVALGAATLAAGHPALSSKSNSKVVRAEVKDGISTCGDDWMATENVKTNNNAIERQGYNAAVDQFCAKAAGQNVGKDKFLSMSTRVWMDYGGSPSTTGNNGFVFFEVHNKKQSNGHVVNEDDCKSHLKALSSTNSKCYGKNNKDTKGGTWQVGSEEVSYHALARKTPSDSASFGKTVLLDHEITELPNDNKGNTLSPFPTYTFDDITPFPCHSHNDYEQSTALFLALSAGCISAEADVYVHGDKLTIAHTSDPGANGKTINDLYLSPLEALVDAHGGVFPSKPSQPFYLLVDFKANGPETWAALVKNLAPLREKGYLSHWDTSKKIFVQRPITVIASGNARVDMSSSQPKPIPEALSDTSNPDHALFVDAVLDKDLANFDKSNAFYASAKFGGKVPMDSAALDRMSAAKAKGLLVRWWDLPGKDKWQTLVDQGIDLLGIDELQSIAGVRWK